MAALRRWWLGVVVALVALVTVGVGGVAPTRVAAATTYVVNSTSDDATTCAMNGVVCLREAIGLAQDGDTVTFDPTVFATPQTIAEARFTINIDHAITLLGVGGGVTVAGTGSDDVIQITDQVGAAKPVTVSALTITGGDSGISVRSARQLTLRNSTITGNGSSGIYNNVGTVVVTNSTLSGNGAHGISNTASTATLTNVTISNNGQYGIYNGSGTLTITNTIIAGNASGGVYSGAVTDGGHNDVTDGSVNDGTTDTTADPLLGTLQNNGGPTPTQAIPAGSPAYHAGDPTTCTAAFPTGAGGLDQRGVTRDSTHCSIGAFEPEAPAVSLGAAPSSASYGAPVTLTATLSATITPGGGPTSGTVSFADNGTAISGCTAQAVNTSHLASCTTNTLSVGTHMMLTASYTPDSTAIFAAGGPSAPASSVNVTQASCVVTSNADTTSTNGIATLRDAVNAANNGGCTNNTITFDTAGIFSTMRTITLGSPLTLNAAMTITGPGASLLTVQGPTTNPPFAFTVPGQNGAANAVSVSGLTVTGTALGFTVSAGRVLTVTNSTISGNQVGINSGGIVRVTDTMLSGNNQGIFNSSGMVSLTRTTITGTGVGIFTSGGVVSVTQSTISGHGDTGIFNSSGTLTVTNTTISGNASKGIFNGASGTVNVTNSLIVNNGTDVSGTLATDNHNLKGSLTFAESDGKTPANHGGVTPTLALVPGSPAIGAGACGISSPDAVTMMSVPITTDQRGVPLPTTGCDIGAFQTRGFTFAMQTGTPQTAAKNAMFGMPLGLTITSSAGDPVVGGTVRFTGPGSGADITTDPVTASITGTAEASTGTVSQPVTANGTAGRFTVTASTAGGTNTLPYTLTIPTSVVSIAHTTPAATLTNAASVIYTVTFADAVSGLTAGDFALTTTGGISGASVGMVTPSSAAPTTTWTVTVTTGSGDGTLRLDFTGAANDTSAPVSNAPFTTGDVYTIDKTAPTVASMPATVPAATIGQAYGPVTFTASDAHTPTITGAMGLPMGFSFTPGTGTGANTATLTGTPTSATTISFTVQTRDAAGNTASVPFSITVNKATPGVSVSGTPTSAAQGVSVTLTATVTGTMGNPTPTGSVVFTSGSLMLGMGTLDGTGKASVTTTALPVGMDPITASYSGDATYATSSGTTTQTVTNAAVTHLSVTAPTGSGSGNSGTATMPVLTPGGSIALTVTGTYTNGTMGSVSGVMFTSSNPNVVAVTSGGMLTAIAPGTATITVTGPNGTMTTITVTVGTVPTGGLMNPNMQPMTHPVMPMTGATPMPRPQPQPSPHPTPGNGVPPQRAGSPTATPLPQPVQH